MLLFGNLATTVLALFVASTLAFYLYFKKTYRYWSNKNVVSLPTWPIIGSQLPILTMDKHHAIVYKEIYDNYQNEKFVGGFKALIPQLIVRDPEILRMVLVKDFNHFFNRNIATTKDILYQHLFMLTGEKWRLLRKKLTPTFTSSKIKNMFPLILECGEMLQEHLNNKMKSQDVHEVKEILAKFTTDSIGSCAFGLQMKSMTDEHAPFRKMGKKFQTSSKNRVIFDFLYALMPKFFSYIGRNRLIEGRMEIQTFFVNIVKQLIKSRTESPSNRHDFIELMMELRNKDLNSNADKANLITAGETIDGDFKLTDELITAQAFVFFSAGYETSALTMSCVLYELAKYPEIQDKLVSEIKTILKNYNGQLTYEAIQEMKYLDMVIDETLRMHPPVGVLGRICTSPYKIPDTNIVLQKGDHVVIPVLGLHYDPKYFPEPEKFIPERFSEDSEKTFHPFSYLPFGEGPRNCIAFRFGKLQSAVGLVTVIKDFIVETCEETPQEIILSPTSFISSFSDGITLRLKRRK